MTIMTTSSCLLHPALLLLLLSTATATASTTTTTTTTTPSTTVTLDDFVAWTKRHSKEYYFSPQRFNDEFWHRFSIFEENAELVERHNRAYQRGETTWTMTLTSSPFADLTADEFAAQYLMDPQDCSATHKSTGRLRPKDEVEDVGSTTDEQHTPSNDNSKSKSKTTINSIGPYDVDWRTKGIFTQVKNQGSCGSCWTFSTTGCLEAHTCLQSGKDCTQWLGLAEQQLVDCAGGAFNNHGCKGGLPSQAYEYIRYNGGIDLESSYLYVANKTDGICKAKDFTIGAQVAGVYNITSRDEDDLMHAIATLGPVSIAYQVSPDFRLYEHGVYDSYNATSKRTMCHSDNHDVNHAVVAVGMGQTQESTKTPYYIVRNSWGSSWGMEGHFWMKRGVNLCGVSDCASFPLVPRRSDDNNDDDDDDDAPPTTTNNPVTQQNDKDKADESVESIRSATATPPTTTNSQLLRGSSTAD